MLKPVNMWLFCSLFFFNPKSWRCLLFQRDSSHIAPHQYCRTLMPFFGTISRCTRTFLIVSTSSVFIPGVYLCLPLELFELAHSHLYPKFSLRCFKALTEKSEMVADENGVLYPNSGSWVTDCLAKCLAQSREWKAPCKTRYQSVLRIILCFCHHNVSLTVPPTETLPAEAQ